MINLSKLKIIEYVKVDSWGWQLIIPQSYGNTLSNFLFIYC